MKKILFAVFFICAFAYAEDRVYGYIPMSATLTSEPISVDSTRADNFDIITLEPDVGISYSVNWYRPLVTCDNIKFDAKVVYNRIASSDKFILCQSTEEVPGGRIEWDYLNDENVDITKTYKLSHIITSNNIEVASSVMMIHLVPETCVVLPFIFLLGIYLRKHIKFVVPILAFSFFASQNLFADVFIDSIKLKDRLPFDSKVDIEYEISSRLGSDVFEVKFQGRFDSGEKFNLETLEGEGMSGIVLGTGKHIVTWDMLKDKPNITSDNFKVTIEAKDVSECPYLVLDLFTFKMKASKNPPKDISTNLICRTDELWLKRCEAGSFIMGSPENELGSEEYRNRETQHRVTLTRPFYLALFELTYSQNALIRDKIDNYRSYIDKGTGDLPASSIARNDHSLTPFFGGFKGIHNSSENALCSLLQRKTGLYYELPTEAQWEYACRAGTKSAIYSGEELIDPEVSANLEALAVYNRPSTNYYEKVGTKMPNVWGFYDMLGNAPEYVLDANIFNNIKVDQRFADDVTDPLYTTKRSVYNDYYKLFKRGGGFDSPAKECRSAFVDRLDVGDRAGIRLSLQFPGQNR